METRHILDETESGFVVRGRPHWLETPDQPRWLIDLAYDELRWRREPIEVRLQRYWLETVTSKETVTFGFYDYYSMVEHVARTLMQWWHPPARDGKYGSEEDHRTAWVHGWALHQCARTMNQPPVHAQWRRFFPRLTLSCSPSTGGAAPAGAIGDHR